MKGDLKYETLIDSQNLKKMILKDLKNTNFTELWEKSDCYSIFKNHSINKDKKKFLSKEHSNFKSKEIKIGSTGNIVNFIRIFIVKIQLYDWREL